MTREILKASLAASLVLAALIQPASAEEFLAVDGADEQLQSRRYEVRDPKLLLQASIAILQDIRYQVTQSEVGPGLLVAQAPFGSCRCSRSLTISIQEVTGRKDSYQVRLTASSAKNSTRFSGNAEPDITDFYQDFFTHLDKELFKERQQ